MRLIGLGPVQTSLASPAIALDQLRRWLDAVSQVAIS